MVVDVWDSIRKEMIIKSFRICGQFKDVKIEEMLAFRDGRVALEERNRMSELLNIDPNEVSIKKLEVVKNENVNNNELEFVNSNHNPLEDKEPFQNDDVKVPL